MIEQLNTQKNLSNQYFSAINDSSIISKTDIYWNITYVNNKFCDISWYSRNELIWKNHNIVRHQDMSSDFFSQMWDTIKNQKTTFYWNIKNKRKNWTHYWVRTMIKPILSSNGDIIEFLSIRQDITKEKDNENILFETIVENIWEAMWIWDEADKTIYANNNFIELLGYDTNEIVGKKASSFFHENDLNLLKKNNLYRKKGKKTKYEANLLTKSWELVPVLISASPTLDWWSVWIITDLRWIKSTQKLSEYQKAMDSANMIIRINTDFSIVSTNEHFLKASQYYKENLIWKNFFDFVELVSKDYNLNLLKQQINAGKLRRWEIKFDAKNQFWYLQTFCTIVPILDKNWEIEEYLVSQNNVTRERLYEEKIQEEKNKTISKLEELNQTKDDFLNIASHELRTPITTIKWYLSMILDGDAGYVDDEVKLYLEKILSSSNRLLMLVNDMLDVQKLESWKMQFEYSEFKIDDLLSDLYEDMMQLAREKQQNIILNNKCEWLYLYSDYNKLLQVLINLVNNAIKFSPHLVDININIFKKDKFIKISVVDRWIWIWEDKLWSIFEKFGQVKNPLTRDINWTWLWLPIVKSIIESLSWDIIVCSEEWKWSTFTISIPK